jgi:hypothetical protein
MEILVSIGILVGGGLLFLLCTSGIHAPRRIRPGEEGYRCDCGQWVGPIPLPPAVIPKPFTSGRRT